MNRKNATFICVILLGVVAGAAFAGTHGSTTGDFSGEKDTVRTTGRQESADTVPVFLFWGEGCAHCDEERQFFAELRRNESRLQVREYEVLKNRKNLELLTQMMKSSGKGASGVPVTFIGNRLFVGFSSHIRDMMVKTINECKSVPCGQPAGFPVNQGAGGAGAAATADKGGASVSLPLLGTLDAHAVSLPLLTLVIAGMDSFNPCAFFVLLSLLGLLVHARSRNKILLVGSVFVFFSGFISLLVMAAWLNLFLVMANVSTVTTAAGIVSLFIASVNIKDFFAFKKGITFSIPIRAKPRLFERMRMLVRSTSLVSILAGTTVLAILANFYELLCTAGFPMVYTRVLTLKHLSTPASYGYLVLYNVIRVLPLFAVVLAFTMTLGRSKLTEYQGRLLKLVSGTMMLGLGGMLLFDPALLNSLVVSLALTAGAAVGSLALAALSGKPRSS
jgi:hypothetical protein